jgi:hypothetical protein
MVGGVGCKDWRVGRYAHLLPNLHFCSFSSLFGFARAPRWGVAISAAWNVCIHYFLDISNQILDLYESTPNLSALKGGDLDGYGSGSFFGPTTPPHHQIPSLAAPPARTPQSHNHTHSSHHPHLPYPRILVSAMFVILHQRDYWKTLFNTVFIAYTPPFEWLLHYFTPMLVLYWVY